MKVCGRCGLGKPIDQFMRRAAKSDGVGSWCRSCSSASAVATKRRVRTELLEALGGSCAHCGFSDPRALQVDHVESDGAVERRECPDAATRYRRILKAVRTGSTRYQLLCANCNWIKRAELEEWACR